MSTEARICCLHHIFTSPNIVCIHLKLMKPELFSYLITQEIDFIEFLRCLDPDLYCWLIQTWWCLHFFGRKHHHVSIKMRPWWNMRNLMQKRLCCTRRIIWIVIFHPIDFSFYFWIFFQRTDIKYFWHCLNFWCWT